MATFFFLSLYCQNVLHYTPIQTGCAFVAIAGPFTLTCQFTPFFQARYGGRLALLGGLALSLIGMELLMLRELSVKQTTIGRACSPLWAPVRQRSWASASRS